MFETPQNPRSTLQVFLGFLLGVLASLGCLLFCISLAGTISNRIWLFAVVNGFALIAVGIIALRQVRQSSYALGVLIAVSLSFLLNAACGVALSR